MICAYVKPEIKKEKIQQQLLQQQMKLVQGDYMENAIWWGRNYTFGMGECKLNAYSQGSPHRFRERGTVQTRWGQQSNIKGGDIFG